jgi:ParB/RepB/Spo0J family partition protein
MTNRTGVTAAAALQIDPASTMFPALPAGEMRALQDSIAANGIMQPIIINAETGRVIDGRHRLQAAIALGMADVPVIAVEGDAVQTAIAANMARRSLTPSQRAAMAVSLMTSSGRAANAAAAARFHVSAGIIAACVRLVERAGRDVLPRVIAGEVSIWGALREAGAAYGNGRAVAVEVAAPAPAPVAAVIVESAPVPAGLSADVAAIIAAFAAGTPVAEAMRGSAVTVEAIDALATYLFAAADIAALRA